MQDNYISWFEAKTPLVNVLSTKSSGNVQKMRLRIVSLDSHALTHALNLKFNKIQFNSVIK